MARIWVGVWSWLPPPIWNSENEHGWQVVHCASAAAIFIGWYRPSMTPSSLPISMANSSAGTSTASDSRADRAKTSLAPAVAQLPGRDGQHHGRAGHQRGQQDVGVAPDEHRVGQHRAQMSLSWGMWVLRFIT